MRLELVVEYLPRQMHERVVKIFIDMLHLHGSQAGELHAEETDPGDDVIYVPSDNLVDRVICRATCRAALNGDVFNDPCFRINLNAEFRLSEVLRKL